MFQTRSIYLPGSRFTRRAYSPAISAQVTQITWVKLVHASNQQILSRIDIAVMHGPALRARPLPDIEPQFVQLVRALAARFAGREPSVHRDHGTAIPPGLILDHASELSEARVGYMPRQRRVFNHVPHRQILDADNLVLAHEARGECMQRVASLVRHGTVGAGDAQPLLLATLTAFDAARQASLLLFQVAQTVGEMARILDLLAGTERGQIRQAKVHADHRGDNRQQGDLDRGAEADVVAPIGLALERDGIGAGDGRQFLGEFHRTELRQAHNTVYPFRFADILKAQRAIHLPRLEARVTGGLTGFHAPEEIDKSAILIAQALRQARCRNLGEPGEFRNRLELCEPAGNSDAGERLFASGIGFGTHIKRPIPQPARRAVPLIQDTNLCAIGIGANAEGAHGCWHSQSINRAAADGNYLPSRPLLRNRAGGSFPVHEELRCWN